METMKQIAVPDIGEFADVPVIEILVQVGDSVEVEDPLIAIESDKATMEIPAPFAGIVREILLALGDKVSEGTPMLVIEASQGAGESAESPVADGAAAGDGLETVPASVPASPRQPEALPNTLNGAPLRDWSSVYAGPAVRRRARELRIDLRTVPAGGRRGRTTLEDLDRAIAAGVGAADAGALSPTAPVAGPKVDFAKFGEIERVPLSRIQKLSGANLARNWTSIPHVTHNEDADITELEAFRKQLNSEQSEVKVTMVALLLKAAASALAAYPQFNCSLDGEDLVLKRYYHLGFAADTPHGLVVPVVRDVGRKGLLQIAADLVELSGKARAGRLSPAEMSGGTFTISSLGGIGGTSFTPIINAPEVAILGVVRSAMKPVWNGREFQPRLILPLSLSYDHRVIDGAAAARFCAHLAGLLSDMRRVLL